MDVIYNIIEYGATTFDAIIPFVFLTVLFGRKQTIKPSVFYVSAVLTTVFNEIVFFFVVDKDLIQEFCMVTIVWCFAIFLLNGKLWEKLVYVMVYDIILSITNMITVFSAASLFSIQIEKFLQVGTRCRVAAIFCNKIMIILVLVFILWLEKKSKLQFRGRILVICGYMAISIAGTAVIQYTRQQKAFGALSVEMLIWIMVALIAMMVVFTICIYQLDKQYHYKLENELLNAKLKEEKHMLQKINEMYEDNQILRHDLKRYLTVAQGMARNNEMESLQRYLEEVLGEQFEAYQLYHTNSSVINAVLNDKANICKKIILHIRLRCPAI